MRSKVQARNREVVLMARAMERRGNLIYQEGEVIVGCIYREDGFYTKLYLKPDLDNIARFICSSDNDKLLCNLSDYAIASTMGTYLDLSVASFLEKILPQLEKYQNKGGHPTFEEVD